MVFCIKRSNDNFYDIYFVIMFFVGFKFEKGVYIL